MKAACPLIRANRHFDVVGIEGPGDVLGEIGGQLGSFNVGRLQIGELHPDFIASFSPFS